MNRHSHRQDAVPKLRDRIREVTHETILGAAEEVFADEGLHAARMEAIAARAGVAVGTLYNHFKDRESLLEALLKAGNDELLRRMDAALEANAKQPFRRQLTAFYRALLDSFYAHRKFLAIFMQTEHCRSASSAVVVGAPSDAMKQVLVRAERLMKQGLKEKALRSEGAELLPILCVGIGRSVLVREMLYTPSEVPIAERVEQMVGFFLGGAGA